MKLKWHKTMTEKKWSQFPLSQQILMIANELSRATSCIKRNDPKEVNLCYERAFELIYLTVAISKNYNFLREFLRFKELLAEQYIASKKDLKKNERLQKVLISLNSEAFNLLYPA